MPLFIRIEAVGLEEGSIVAIQTQAVMAALTAMTVNVGQLVPPLNQPLMPAPPPFLTATLYLQ